MRLDQGRNSCTLNYNHVITSPKPLSLSVGIANKDEMDKATVFSIRKRIRYLGEGDERQHSDSCEHNSGNQHDHSRADISAEECDGGQPPTVRNRTINTLE